jgi:hypothetical protein
MYNVQNKRLEIDTFIYHIILKEIKVYVYS